MFSALAAHNLWQLKLFNSVTLKATRGRIGRFFSLRGKAESNKMKKYNNIKIPPTSIDALRTLARWLEGSPSNCFSFRTLAHEIPKSTNQTGGSLQNPGCRMMAWANEYSWGCPGHQYLWRTINCWKTEGTGARAHSLLQAATWLRGNSCTSLRASPHTLMSPPPPTTASLLRGSASCFYKRYILVIQDWISFP